MKPRIIKTANSNPAESEGSLYFSKSYLNSSLSFLQMNCRVKLKEFDSLLDKLLSKVQTNSSKYKYISLAACLLILFNFAILETKFSS